MMTATYALRSPMIHIYMKILAEGGACFPTKLMQVMKTSWLCLFIQIYVGFEWAFLWSMPHHYTKFLEIH